MGQELLDLAGRINALYRAAVSSYSEALGYALTAGAVLIQAKAIVPRGSWLRWVSQNCEPSSRTVQAYMRLAARGDQLESATDVAHLPLRQALKQLAAPSDHEQSLQCFRCDQRLPRTGFRLPGRVRLCPECYAAVEPYLEPSQEVLDELYHRIVETIVELTNRGQLMTPAAFRERLEIAFLKAHNDPRERPQAA